MKNRHVALSIIALTTIVCLTLAMRTQNPAVLGMAALAVGQLVGRVAGNKTGRDVETVKGDVCETKAAAQTAVAQTNGELDSRMAKAISVAIAQSTTETDAKFRSFDVGMKDLADQSHETKHAVRQLNQSVHALLYLLEQATGQKHSLPEIPPLPPPPGRG